MRHQAFVTDSIRLEDQTAEWGGGTFVALNEAKRPGIDIKAEKLTDYAEIAQFGIASTPGIVIDGKVVDAGGLPKEAAIAGGCRNNANAVWPVEFARKSVCQCGHHHAEFGHPNVITVPLCSLEDVLAHDHTSHAISERDFGPAFAWAVGLNAAYVVFEATFGFLTGSLALLADAAHNLTDVAGLLLAWGAVILGRRHPSARHTYGLGRSSILAALFNGVALMIAVGALGWEAIGRFWSPTEVPGLTVLWVALVGIGINTGTALLFLRGRKDDLNVEGAFLHMAADAAVSAGVVVSALLIMATNWQWVDPLAGLLVAAVIAWSSFGLLRSAFHLSLDGTPDGIDKAEVQQWLETRPGVASVHDLHIWALSTTRNALTAHLVIPESVTSDQFLATTSDELLHAFKIDHVTLQIERGDGFACALAPDTVV